MERLKSVIVFIGTSTKTWMALTAIMAAFAYIREWRWTAGVCTGLLLYWVTAHFYEQRISLLQQIVDTQKEAIELRKKAQTVPDIAANINELSRLLTAHMMGPTAWSYDPQKVAEVYRAIDGSGIQFERLVQILNAHQAQQVIDHETSGAVPRIYTKP